MTNHMQPDDQQSPAPEVETSQGAAPETMPAEATPLPEVAPDASEHGEDAPAAETEGDAAPETVVTVDNATLEIEADVTNLPEALVVSVEGLEVGTQILAGQVEMPAGSTLVSDPELLVVNITQQISAEELEAELAEAEAEAGIEHDESDAEAAEAAEGEGESTEGGEESSEQE